MAKSTGNLAPSEVTLSRDLRLFDITMVGVGAMIGAGIFVLTGTAAGVAGPALGVAFLLNGLVTLFTAMSYAELGSCFFEAGGGYLWVKEGLGGTYGFLSGWMSWFAHSVACSLYGLGFGRFATELVIMAGLPTLGLTTHQMTLIFMTGLILFLTYVNYLGASETGTIGNIVTLSKLALLLLFSAFGLLAIRGNPDWQSNFSQDFLPHGMGGIFMAMGVTFIAFEGYEIIAQCGEEVENPRRNIPRAIFLATGIVVVVYLLIAFVVIGAIESPLPGVPSWQYLGEWKEVAIVEAARQFMPYGAVLLLIGGLMSTTSALNATIYSSSRVSFAMGRDSNLPSLFSRIHPRRHTPHYAILISGAFITAMAWLLPIEDAASAADIMFLLLFILVNLTALRLRRTRPELERGFHIPWFPYPPILGIITQLFLAVYMFRFSPLAWYIIAGWLVGGMLLYWGHFSRIEELEKPKEILLEEVLVSRRYSVLVPVVDAEQGRILGSLASPIARDRGGEILALHVARVPPQLSLSDGRLLLREGRPPLEAVISEAKEYDVPVHTMIRLGRNVVEAVRKTCLENASDLIILAWPGHTASAGRVFGSIIDPIIHNPPTDIAMVRHRNALPVRSILVPMAGGPHSRLAASFAVSLARQHAQPAPITILHILPPEADQASRIRAEKAIHRTLHNLSYDFTIQFKEGESVPQTILNTAQERGHELIILGATQESLFESLLAGSIPEQVASRAPVTVIMVKRRSGRLSSFLRETVLEQSGKAKVSEG